MKTIKQKKLTGRPEIDKYLTAGTGLREMVYIPKEMSLLAMKEPLTKRV